jgi:hypothetical protein
MKKLTALILSLILLLSATTPAFAAQTETAVSPRYVNTSQGGVSLVITEDGLAEWTIICLGKSNCTGIDAVTYLERKMGTVWMRMSVDHPIKEYYYSVTGTELANTYQMQLNFTGEYRAVVEYTVHGTVEDEELKFWSYGTYE